MSTRADAGFVVLVNARAGGGRPEPAAIAHDTLAGYGTVEVVEAATSVDLDRVLDGLDGRRLVVAGGDGSVHRVVQRLHDRGELELDLALVPAGTGNDLARSLAVPLDPARAAEVAATGEVRRLDLLVDDRGDVVVNAVHAGLGAEAAQRSERIKPGLGPLAYPLGALVAGVREDGWQLEVAVDDAALAAGTGGRLLMVGVANGRTIGGGAPLCPHAEPDDGLLDVVVVGAVGPAARAAFGAALRDGRHLDREDVSHRRGETVRIAGEPVRFNADGEVSEPARARTFRIEPGRWQLRVPRGG